MEPGPGAPLGKQFFDLSREEQEEVLRPRKEIQDMIREFNEAFPPPTATALHPKWLSPTRQEAEREELEILRQEFNRALA